MRSPLISVIMYSVIDGNRSLQTFPETGPRLDATCTSRFFHRAPGRSSPAPIRLLLPEVPCASVLHVHYISFTPMCFLT